MFTGIFIALTLTVSGAVTLDFDTGKIPPNLIAYGSDVKLSASAQSVVAEFNDSSKIAWCNKGFEIRLPKPVAWKDFDFIDISASCNKPVTITAMTITDEQNNVWYAFFRKGIGKDGLRFEKNSFRYSYNQRSKDAPRLTEKTGRLQNLSFYVGTRKVNTGETYRLELKKITFEVQKDEVASVVVPTEKNTVPFATYGDIRKPISETVHLSLDNGKINLKFNDKSPIWFHKGARIKLDKPIDWNEFAGVGYDYSISHPVTMVALCMLDDRGVWWECFSANKGATESGKVRFEKDSFHRSELTYKYDDTPYKKVGKIVELYPFFGVAKANRGIEYTGTISDLHFIKKFADGHFQYEVEPNYSLQWKNNRVRKDGTMLVDGKPFFPLMLYSSFGFDMSSGTYKNCAYTGPTDEKTSLKRLKAIRDAGFNTMMSYTLNLYGQKVSGPGWTSAERAKFPGYASETTEELYHEAAQKFLDSCAKVGLKGMIGGNSTYTLTLPLPPEDRKNRWEIHKGRITRTINRFKDHPALLMWYMYDEPSSMNTPPNDLIQTYQFAKKLDQNHPFYMAAADPRNDQEYFSAVDIVAPDSYPLAFNKPITNDTRNLPAYKKAQKNGWPQVWQIVQVCQWKPELQDRLPTEKQIRTQCFLGLADNLKGLAFYSYYNYPEKRPEQWRAISGAVNSLHTFLPDVLASEKVITDGLSDNKDVRYILHQPKGKGYLLLLAVNGKENFTDELPRKEPVPVSLGKVSFRLPGVKIRKIEALDEDANGNLSLGKIRELKTSGDRFSDDFPAYATHAYRIYPEK